MRCTCGQPGSIVTKRRDFPYCQECFKQHIIRAARKEAGKAPVRLQPAQSSDNATDNLSSSADWEAAVRAICEAAGRKCTADREGAVPGCAEIAAAEFLNVLLGIKASAERVFPSSISYEEMQLFYSPLATVKLDKLAEEVRVLEDRYPGTVSSILHSAADRAL